jgi:hemerythrin-like metal-binding protein
MNAMALVEWRDEFRTGIASVDHEHEELIQVINDLHAQLAGHADKETVANFLGEINAKISAHFALEEKIMRERGYDQYADHKADHERLLDGIRDIMDNFDQGTYMDYDDALTAHLRHWFTHHFKTKDARFHKMMG